MEECKKILEKQLELLSKESQVCTLLEEKLKVNKEICRTANTLILIHCQTRYGAAGKTR